MEKLNPIREDKFLSLSTLVKAIIIFAAAFVVDLLTTGATRAFVYIALGGSGWWGLIWRFFLTWVIGSVLVALGTFITGNRINIYADYIMSVAGTIIALVPLAYVCQWEFYYNHKIAFVIILIFSVCVAMSSVESLVETFRSSVNKDLKKFGPQKIAIDLSAKKEFANGADIHNIMGGAYSVIYNTDGVPIALEKYEEEDKNTKQNHIHSYHDE